MSYFIPFPLFGRKRVFVASSTEGKKIAMQVIDKLKNKGLAPLAWFDCFKNSRPPLQELEKISLSIDAAVLVATSDDQVIIREKNWNQMRDNVLYEFGLFSGILGRSRCGLLVPDREDFRIPSDFTGVSCFQTYNPYIVESDIITLIDALFKSISNPVKPDTTMTRGRRLLQLVGWIRDETFRLAQNWDDRYGKEIIASRVIGVSGFLKNDIDSLRLGREYQRIEEIILAATDNFPRIRKEPPDVRYALRNLVDGIYPNVDIWRELMHTMERKGIFEVCSNSRENHHDCPGCQHWVQKRDWLRHEGVFRHPIFPHYHVNSCAPYIWAVGASEAITMFEKMMAHANPMPELEAWSRQYLSMLNESIIAFERRLHEEIFGSL